MKKTHQMSIHFNNWQTSGGFTHLFVCQWPKRMHLFVFWPTWRHRYRSRAWWHHRKVVVVTL